MVYLRNSAGGIIAIDQADNTGEYALRGIRSATSPQTERFRVGGSVQAARLISKVDPVYPVDAQAAGVEGSVTIRGVISKTGNFLNVTSMNSGVDPRLARAAKDAVRNW